MSDRPRIPFVTSPLRLVSLILVAGLVLAAAFGLGLFVKSPNNQALTVADTQLTITVPAQIRTISNATQIQATIIAGDTSGISMDAVDGADIAVATQGFVKPGEVLHPGKALGTVSGRPLFMTNSNVPLYRNLKLKDTGPDVLGLQVEFRSWGYAVNQTGVVGENFLAVLRAIYATVDVDPPGGDGATFLSWKEFAHLPAVGATVISVAAIGSQVTKDNPLVKVKTSSDRVVGRAGLSSGERFKTGAPVVLNFSGTPAESTVTSVSGFIEGDGTKPAGIDITVSIPSTLTDLRPGGTGTVSTNTPDVKGLAVPLTGIRTDSNGQYLLVVDALATGDASSAKVGGASIPPARHTPIEILGQAEGWVVLKPATAIKEGELVLVSP